MKIYISRKQIIEVNLNYNTIAVDHVLPLIIVQKKPIGVPHSFLVLTLFIANTQCTIPIGNECALLRL